MSFHGYDLGSDGTQGWFWGLRDGQRVQDVVTMAKLMFSWTFEHCFVLPERGVFGKVQRLLVVVQVVQHGRAEPELDR